MVFFIWGAISTALVSLETHPAIIVLSLICVLIAHILYEKTIEDKDTKIKFLEDHIEILDQKIRRAEKDIDELKNRR